MDEQHRLRAVYWAARRCRTLMEDAPTVRFVKGERYLTGASPAVIEKGIDLGRIFDKFAEKIGPKRWDKLVRWFITGTAGMRNGRTPYIQMHNDLAFLFETIERSSYHFLIGGVRELEQ